MDLPNSLVAWQRCTLTGEARNSRESGDSVVSGSGSGWSRGRFNIAQKKVKLLTSYLRTQAWLPNASLELNRKKITSEPIHPTREMETHSSGVMQSRDPHLARRRLDWPRVHWRNFFQNFKFMYVFCQLIGLSFINSLPIKAKISEQYLLRLYSTRCGQVLHV